MQAPVQPPIVSYVPRLTPRSRPAHLSPTGVPVMQTFPSQIPVPSQGIPAGIPSAAPVGPTIIPSAPPPAVSAADPYHSGVGGLVPGTTRVTRIPGKGTYTETIYSRV